MFAWHIAGRLRIAALVTVFRPCFPVLPLYCAGFGGSPEGIGPVLLYGCAFLFVEGGVVTGCCCWTDGGEGSLDGFV